MITGLREPHKTTTLTIFTDINPMATMFLLVSEFYKYL